MREVEEAQDTPAQDPRQSVHTEQASGEAQRSLLRIQEAVALANRFGKLRLMIPAAGNVRQMHERQWRELLKVLGLQVELVIVTDYESLKRDSESPVLMPRQMHTHTSRWKKGMAAPLYVIDFPFPKLLLNLMEAASAR